MLDDEQQKKVNVKQTNTFEKALKKLSDQEQDLVDDEIELIIANPEIGEPKKGDLSHMRVHKFKVDAKEMLLGYNWNEGKLTICLLMLASHENFYRSARNRRSADLNFVS